MFMLLIISSKLYIIEYFIIKLSYNFSLVINFLKKSINNIFNR